MVVPASDITASRPGVVVALQVVRRFNLATAVGFG